MAGSIKVCIGVCTVKRPQLLMACLKSLAAQRSLEGSDLHILVVENDQVPASKPIVGEVAQSSPYPIHYLHEPRRGIPFARNRVLDEANHLDADWVAFIDDDQQAMPDWVEKMLLVAKRDEAEMVGGYVHYVAPEPVPFWYTGSVGEVPAERGDGPLETRTRTHMASNGVIIARRLFDRSLLGLRFNEKLALGGEEDGEFSENAHSHGARIVVSSLPLLTEEVHRSRCTYLRHVKRGLGRGGAYVTKFGLRHSRKETVRRYAGVVAARGLRGLGQLVVSPIFIPFSVKRFKFTALEAGRNLFMAAGIIGAFFSWRYNYYDRIDGR